MEYASAIVATLETDASVTTVEHRMEPLSPARKLAKCDIIIL